MIPLALSLVLQWKSIPTFSSDSNGLCSAHLVNDGSTISAGSVTIEWQLTGPSAENRTTLAQCFLDDNLQGSLCKFTHFIYIIQPRNSITGKHVIGFSGSVFHSTYIAIKLT